MNSPSIMPEIPSKLEPFKFRSNSDYSMYTDGDYFDALISHGRLTVADIVYRETLRYFDLALQNYKFTKWATGKFPPTKPQLDDMLAFNISDKGRWANENLTMEDFDKIRPLYDLPV